MAAFDPDKEIPQHIAIIMDGNGRWARERGQPRREGHRAGAESVEIALETCGEIGVDYLTIYAFSSENWKRPEAEVKALMGLLAHFLKEKTSSLVKNNIRLQVIGQIDKLPKSNQKELEKSIEATAGNDGLTLVVALSYGSREEIVEATRALMRKAQDGELDPDNLDEATFAAQLNTAAYPDPDLLIRTSGEYRISNFLLWQISYSEIFITKTLWPDFRRDNLLEAVGEYQKRQRRFGGV
ncbi:MAG: isoprenyl transferase [Verrucomicrobiales bacterium]|nr:isoprenyl transferase [Verrucomicrobiales bacterium]|tara:strand:- start:775 stop:1494 length:720 start_codon:yes stop_codon:yes gene_type:complete